MYEPDIPPDFIGIGVEPYFAELLTYLFSLAGVSGTVEIVTSGSSVQVGPNVSAIILNKTIAGATIVQLGQISRRTVAPLQIVDWGGNAGDITVLPYSGETIMGISSATLTSYAQGYNSSASVTFWPNQALNGWYNAP